MNTLWVASFTWDIWVIVPWDTHSDASGASSPQEPTSFNCTQSVSFGHYCPHPCLSMPIKSLSESGSAALSPTSTTSSGLTPFGWYLCAFCLVWSCELPHVATTTHWHFYTSQWLASLGWCQLELHSPKCKFSLASVATRVFKCGCGNEESDQHYHTNMFTCGLWFYLWYMQWAWYMCHRVDSNVYNCWVSKI